MASSQTQTGNPPILIGVIGSDQWCGSRAAGAVGNILSVEPDAKLVAIADLLPDRLKCTLDSLSSYRSQSNKSQEAHPDVPCFSGFDAYKKLLAIPEINYVVVTPPPHFRPAYLRAAIEAGKHVFIEAPVAVDATGVRSVLASGELARKKKLGVGVGFHKRHLKAYIETIQRIHAGDIGRPMECHATRNLGAMWSIRRQAEDSDVEWQVRNWPYFSWLSGDWMLSQHVQELDEINWAMKTHPLRAYGMGGRQIKTDAFPGNVYDHFAVQYEYPDGVMLFSQCRVMNDCETTIQESIKGIDGWSNRVGRITGKIEWRFSGRNRNPYELEHENFIASIRSGEPLNDAQTAAESTLTGIMGREAAYCGKTIEWDAALNSKQNLSPEVYEWGPLPVGEPPMPGKYRFT